MLREIEGIVMSVTPYGDSSKIINVYTKEEGIIGILCKGAMSVKNKYRAITMKMCYGKFNIYFKKGKLSTLANASLINNFTNIRSDILLISYASYLLDLVSQVMKQTSEEKIYDELISALIKIEEGLDPMVITNIMEVKLLDYLGVGINLTSCIMCGSKKEIVTLASEKGGLICKNCYHGERLMPLSIIKTLNLYYLVDIKSISKLSLKKDIVMEINNFLTNYYEDYTGLYLKSKNFLQTIVKL